MTVDKWERRFRWLLDAATDGFATPGGWASFMNADDPRDMADIDQWIANGEARAVQAALAPEALMAASYQRLVELRYNPFYATI